MKIRIPVISSFLPTLLKQVIAKWVGGIKMKPAKGWKHPLSNRIQRVGTRQLAFGGPSIHYQPHHTLCHREAGHTLLGTLGTAAPVCIQVAPVGTNSSNTDYGYYLLLLTMCPALF